MVHFTPCDQSVMDCLVRGIESLRQERKGALLVLRERRLRRAILMIAEANLIDKYQRSALLENVLEARRQALVGHSLIGISTETERSLGIKHAKEYMCLIPLASDRLGCEQAVLEAQEYFQTLIDSRLIDVDMLITLSRQAILLLDDWKPAA